MAVPPDNSYRQGITWNPQNWAYPPSCWRPRQEFIDTISIPLGDKPLPGGWLFSIAITDFYAKQPMSLPAQNAVQVGIGPVQIH